MASPPERRAQAAAAAAASGVLVGSAIVATRFVAAELGPASLAFLRYLVGFCCLAPALLLSGRRLRFARRDVPPIALLGIAQFGVLVALLNAALRDIPAAEAALLFATMPLLTLLIAAALGRERLTLAKLAGVLLTILGVGLALGGKAVADAGPGHWRGAAMALASALVGALCSVLYRPYLRKYPTLTVSAFAMLASVAFLALLAAAEGFFAAPPRLAAAGWGAVLFIGANSGVGYVLWLWALDNTTPTRVTVFLALSPITAAVLGAALLGEPVAAPTGLGVAAVVAGLWLAHRTGGAGPAGGRANRVTGSPRQDQ